MHAVVQSHQLQPTSIGLALFYIFPGAFVTLNEADLKSLHAFDRLSIWSGGIAHNAVLSLSCWLLSSRGLAVVAALQSVTLWENVGHKGLAVQSIASVSTVLQTQSIEG